MLGGAGLAQGASQHSARGATGLRSGREGKGKEDRAVTREDAAGWGDYWPKGEPSGSHSSESSSQPSASIEAQYFPIRTPW